MYQVTVTSDVLQFQTLILPDSSQVDMQIRYVPMQLGWFFDYITYGSWTVKGVRIVNSPNMLHQYINQIPFGIYVATTGDREPSQQQDFQYGNSNMYVLSEDEVLTFDNFLKGIG